MMLRKSVLLPVIASMLMSVSAWGQAGSDLPLAVPGAVPEKLAGGFSFTEGPASDRAGNVFFTDQPNDRILEWSADNKLTTFMMPSQRSNGMFIDNRGIIWSCADEKNRLLKIYPGGRIETVVESYEGKPFNGPNDVWVAPGGGAYITDPFYARPWWDHKSMPQEKQRVYYIAPGSNKAVVVVDDMKAPNGIVGTPDGKTLYIADIAGNKTWKYTVNDDGTLSGKTLFCEPGSDGMTMDEEGNIYLTGQGVTIFDKWGKKLGNIPIPENWTANVCFGGHDHKSLFITASKGLYRLKMKVRGAF